MWNKEQDVSVHVTANQAVRPAQLFAENDAVMEAGMFVRACLCFHREKMGTLHAMTDDGK